MSRPKYKFYLTIHKNDTIQADYSASFYAHAMGRMTNERKGRSPPLGNQEALEVPWRIYKMVAKSLIKNQLTGIPEDSLAKFIKKLEKDKDMSDQDLYNFIHTSVKKIALEALTVQAEDSNETKFKYVPESEKSPMIGFPNLTKWLVEMQAMKWTFFKYVRMQNDIRAKNPERPFTNYEDIFWGGPSGTSQGTRYFDPDSEICILSYDKNNEPKRKYINPQQPYTLNSLIKKLGENDNADQETFTVYYEDGTKEKNVPRKNIENTSRFKQLTQVPKDERNKNPFYMSQSNTIITFQEYIHFIYLLTLCQYTAGVPKNVFMQFYLNIKNDLKFSPLDLINCMKEAGFDTHPPPADKPSCATIYWFNTDTQESIWGDKQARADMDALLAKYNSLMSKELPVSEATRTEIQRKLAFQTAPLGLMVGSADSTRTDPSAMAVDPPRNSEGQAKKAKKNSRDSSRDDPPNSTKRRREHDSASSLHSFAETLTSKVAEPTPKSTRPPEPVIIPVPQQSTEQLYTSYLQQQRIFIKSLDANTIHKCILHVKHGFAPPIPRFLLDQLPIDDVTMRLHLHTAIHSGRFPIRHLPDSLLHPTNTVKRNATLFSTNLLHDITTDAHAFVQAFAKVFQQEKPTWKSREVSLVERMYVAHWLFAHNPNRSNLDALYLHLYESNDWLPILLLPVIPLFSIRPASSTTDGSNIQTALAEPLNSKIMLENSLSSIPNIVQILRIQPTDMQPTNILFDCMHAIRFSNQHRYALNLTEDDERRFKERLCPVYINLLPKNQDFDIVHDINYHIAMHRLKTGQKIAFSTSFLQEETKAFCQQYSKSPLLKYMMTTLIPSLPVKLPSTFFWLVCASFIEQINQNLNDRDIHAIIVQNFTPILKHWLDWLKNLDHDNLMSIISPSPWDALLSNQEKISRAYQAI